MKWLIIITLYLMCVWAVSFVPDAALAASATAAAASAVVADQSQTSEITFTYEDADYERVSLAGSFTDWVRIPLTRDGDQWSVALPVPSGPQYYRFIVTDDGETWEAIDPGNQAAQNHAEFGWVSIVDFSAQEDFKTRSRAEAREQRRQRKRYRKLVEQELRFGTPDHRFAGYQRVDGLTLGLVLNHVGKQGTLEPSARGYLGYGFSSGRAGAGLTILQPLIPHRILALKISLYDWTDFNDQTGIGNVENSLAAIFLHEDYRDYYRNKGVRGSAVLQPASWLRLEAGVLAEEHSSLRAPSVWSLKKGDFHDNPAIDDGSLRSVLARLHVGDRYNHLRLVYEHSAPDLMGGSYDFSQFTATARGRLELGERAGFDVRLKGGSNFQGRLPAQRRYVVGGLGTVRGYAYQSLLTTDPDSPPDSTDRQPFGGERLLLANIEYSFRVSDWLGMALFYDAGMAWQDRNATVSLNQLKTSTGLGIMPWNQDGLRLDIIQKLDDRDSEPVFQIRLQRMF